MNTEREEIESKMCCHLFLPRNDGHRPETDHLLHFLLQKKQKLATVYLAVTVTKKNVDQ